MPAKRKSKTAAILEAVGVTTAKPAKKRAKRRVSKVAGAKKTAEG